MLETQKIPYALGIDVGSTTVKTVLLTEMGEVLSSAMNAISPRSEKPYAPSWHHWHRNIRTSSSVPASPVLPVWVWHRRRGCPLYRKCMRRFWR